MSKTRGNVLDPFAVMETYGIDALRFYLFREVAFGQDGVISLDGFALRYNNELANELGNLVSRSASMVGKYRGGVAPAGAGTSGDLATGRRGHGRRLPRPLDDVEITAAMENIWEFVRRLNRYVEEQAPWKLAKDEAQAARLNQVLYDLVAGLRLVALCLYPVMPGTADRDPATGSGSLTGRPTCCWTRRSGSRRRRPPCEWAPPLFPRIEAAE